MPIEPSSATAATVRAMASASSRSARLTGIPEASQPERRHDRAGTLGCVPALS